MPVLNWTPFVGPRVVEIKVKSRLPLSFKNQAASCCICCGYVGNAFALSKRSGISTALAAASILSMPARHTAIGVGFQMDFFVLDRAPQPFDENVVHEAAASVHRNHDAGRHKLAG